MLAYSAKKKNTKITAACSVINPLTNSDSIVKYNNLLYPLKGINFKIVDVFIHSTSF